MDDLVATCGEEDVQPGGGQHEKAAILKAVAQGVTTPPSHGELTDVDAIEHVATVRAIFPQGDDIDLVSHGSQCFGLAAHPAIVQIEPVKEYGDVV